jgi:hypothetical protein
VGRVYERHRGAVKMEEYHVNGVFWCDVEAKNWRDAMKKGERKVREGDIGFYVMDAEKREEKYGNT